MKPPVGGVAVLAQDEALGAQLDPLGLPDAIGDVGDAAALVVHRDESVVTGIRGFQHIDDGDETQFRR